ncbi:TonB-dependent receptor [Membranihabitans marinus]|uniref:TonB-dependent receptor n=1 Tax=Membranihabitans marinus TaxID=1227546 RepID=UPI001F166065|nr:TonB-dependent receptor [Membranihabitans marinus]
MRHIISLLFSIVWVSTVSAQETVIYGQISSESDILPFATIRVMESSDVTVADDGGQYRLNLDQQGEFHLEITFVGHLKKQIPIYTEDLDSMELNIVMESILAMDEIVVTGSMKPTYVSESPIKIDVISFKQLETFMPIAASSIVESIQLINGVEEVIACGVCYTNSISINGLPGPYTAVLIDGMPMFGNLASVYGLNGIPSMIIDRMEVIKGPNSTLYGSEAVAGVVNIITKDVKEQPFLSLDIMETSHVETFGNLALAPKFKNANGYIGVNFAYINDFDDVNQDGFGDGVNLDRWSIFSKWNIDRKSGKEFSIVGRYYYEDRRNGVEEYLVDRNYRDLRGSSSIYGESIYTKRLELFGKYVFNTKPDLRLEFSWSDHHQDSYYGDAQYLADQSILYNNLLWNINPGNHDILMGWTNRYQIYDDNSEATSVTDAMGNTVNQRDIQYIPGLFIQDEWSISPKWTLLSGARLDHYKDHGLIFSPRINIKNKWTDGSSFRINMGTGFRIVNLFTEDHAFVTGQREVVITEALKPERSYNMALNFNRVFALFEGAGSIDIDAYYTYFTNKIIPDYDTPGQIIYGNSNGHASTKGIGANINYGFLFPLRLSLGMNFQNAVEVERNIDGDNETRNIEFAPNWTGVFTANYSWAKHRFSISYTGRITGPMTLPTVYDLSSEGQPLTHARPTTSPVFSLHNIQCNKELGKNISIYAGLQNIFNYRQYYSPLVGYNDVNADPGFSPYFDTAYAFSPNHGREFYLGIKFDIY